MCVNVIACLINDGAACDDVIFGGDGHVVLFGGAGNDPQHITRHAMSVCLHHTAHDLFQSRRDHGCGAIAIQRLAGACWVPYTLRHDSCGGVSLRCPFVRVLHASQFGHVMRVVLCGGSCGGC